MRSAAKIVQRSRPDFWGSSSSRSTRPGTKGCRALILFMALSLSAPSARRRPSFSAVSYAPPGSRARYDLAVKDPGLAQVESQDGPEWVIREEPLLIEID